MMKSITTFAIGFIAGYEAIDQIKQGDYVAAACFAAMWVLFVLYMIAVAEDL